MRQEGESGGGNEQIEWKKRWEGKEKMGIENFGSLENRVSECH